MLDKLSKSLLEYLNKPKNAADRFYDFSGDLNALAKDLHVDEEELRAAVRYLNENGYLKYQLANNAKPFKFSLDHKGLHWREFRRQEIAKYLEEKWIDFAALLLSVIALICSLA